MSSTPVSPVHKRIGVAVITNQQGKVLIDRRKDRGEMAGLWEFPGGKIEPGETIEECIEREIKEELDIKIIVGDRLITITHAYKTFNVTLYVHECQHIGGEPKPLECQEIHWVEPAEMDRYKFPRANTQIINILRQKGINE